MLSSEITRIKDAFNDKKKRDLVTYVRISCPAFKCQMKDTWAVNLYASIHVRFRNENFIIFIHWFIYSCACIGPHGPYTCRNKKTHTKEKAAISYNYFSWSDTFLQE
jgi:hypothetical protein